MATPQGPDAQDSADACYLDKLGMRGNQAANLAVQTCNLLIAVSTRFNDRVTSLLNAFAPHAKVIHLDIDPPN